MSRSLILSLYISIQDTLITTFFIFFCQLALPKRSIIANAIIPSFPCSPIILYHSSIYVNVFPQPVAPYAIIVELQPSRIPSMKWERDSSYIDFVAMVLVSKGNTSLQTKSKVNWVYLARFLRQDSSLESMSVSK